MTAPLLLASVLLFLTPFVARALTGATNDGGRGT